MGNMVKCPPRIAKKSRKLQALALALKTELKEFDVYFPKAQDKAGLTAFAMHKNRRVAWEAVEVSMTKIAKANKCRVDSPWLFK